MGSWVETVAPTCTSGGKESQTCTTCGLVRTRNLDALGHDYDDGVQVKKAFIKDGEVKYTCKRCGDYYSEEVKGKIWILPVICIGGVLLLIGILNYIRMMKKKS